MSVLNGPCPHRLNHLRLTLLLAAAIAAGEFRALGQSEAPRKDAALVLGQPATAAAPTEPLRHAAKCRFLVGAAVMSRQLQDPRLATLVARQFDCLTGENEFKLRDTPARRAGQQPIILSPLARPLFQDRGAPS